jgi:hypothetical protein
MKMTFFKIGFGLIMIGAVGMGLWLINPKNWVKETVSIDEKQECPANESKRIEFEKVINIDEAVEINFRMRDYKWAPKNYIKIAELESRLIPLPGKASFKIKEIGQQNKIGEVLAVEGKTYFYVLFEFKGWPENPKGETIKPKEVDETGWDSAPQIVLIWGDKEYTQDGYGTELLRDKGLKTEKASLQQAEWTTQAAAWYQDKNQEPIFAVKYINKQGQKKYIKINNG